MSEFFCEKCHYRTTNKQHFDNHNLSNRHTEENNELHFECSCHRRFKTQSGMRKHKKTCEININTEQNQKNSNSNTNTNTSMNQSDHNTIANTTTTEQSHNTETTNNNSHNTTNNTSSAVNHITILNLLNSDYGNVITFEDFLKNINIDIEDIEGITDKESCFERLDKIILDRLKMCDIKYRPFHCVVDKDENFETFIKNNEWVREYTKHWMQTTPVVDKRVLDFISKIYKDIEDINIDALQKENLKKILRAATKKENIMNIRDGLYYGIHINKYELNHKLKAKETDSESV